MMGGHRLRLLQALRDRGPSDMGDLADVLSLGVPAVYDSLELMLRDGLVEQAEPNSDVYGLSPLGQKALDVIDLVKSGPPGWKQRELW